MEKLERTIDFIRELDKMKSILRMTQLIGSEERENDAEHSWHIAVMAMVLEDYADRSLDSSRVIRMLLIHDLVEIYAGDTFAYDKNGYKDKSEREARAADKLYAMLPEGKSRELRGLWDEFEAMESDEAKFANALDRLQPILNNYYNQGGTWRKYKVPRSSILARIEPIKEISSPLYNYTLGLLEESISLGYIED